MVFITATDSKLLYQPFSYIIMGTVWQLLNHFQEIETQNLVSRRLYLFGIISLLFVYVSHEEREDRQGRLEIFRNSLKFTYFKEYLESCYSKIHKLLIQPFSKTNASIIFITLIQAFIELLILKKRQFDVTFKTCLCWAN